MVCCGVNHPPNLSGLKTTQVHFSLMLHMNSASCCPSSRIQLPGQPFSGGLPIFRRKAKENMGNAPLIFKFPPESDTSSQSHVIGQSKSFGHIKLHGAREGQFCHMPPSRAPGTPPVSQIAFWMKYTCTVKLLFMHCDLGQHI